MASLAWTWKKACTPSSADLFFRSAAFVRVGPSGARPGPNAIRPYIGLAPPGATQAPLTRRRKAASLSPKEARAGKSSDYSLLWRFCSVVVHCERLEWFLYLTNDADCIALTSAKGTRCHGQQSMDLRPRRSGAGSCPNRRYPRYATIFAPMLPAQEGTCL